MITKSQKNKIKKILGRHYSTKILSFMQKNNILNNKGQLYTATTIRSVMNGVRETQRVIDAIFDCVEEEKQKQQVKEDRRNQILTKKSDAVTSD